MVNLPAQIGPVVTFTGDTGASPGSQPVTELTTDASGDLLGTTQGYGGEVFEVVNNGTVSAPQYSNTPTILASFNFGGGPLGYLPVGGLVKNSEGDLFGINSGGAGHGVVFEIPKSAGGYGAAQAISTFDGTNGDQPAFDGTYGNQPVNNLVVDAQGNIYGETEAGGSSFDEATLDLGFGVVFEIAKDPSSATGYDNPTVLVSFTGTGVDGSGNTPGAYPSGLLSDSNGDLFGVTADGGASGDGEVFELTNGGNFTVVANFGGATGSGLNPFGLATDSKGDLFGTTSAGGQYGDGTIYEIAITPGGYGPLQTLASFDGADGDSPQASLTIDAAGNLFGTTESGSDNGVAFELQRDSGSSTGYAATPSVLLSFDSRQFGILPESNLASDGAGDLLGTALGGDASNDGVVFEVANSGFETSVPCFCRGTLIRIESGEAAVEDLLIGDLAVVSGGLRPIRWIGHRAVKTRRHSRPEDVFPFRVRANAFGAGRPWRDLWLSPGHSIAFGGVLIPISALANGASVAQVECDEVEYWHIELDAHDVILAEGLPTESYLDQGNRTAFVNGGAFVQAHPDFRPKHFAETCLPLVWEGPDVARARRRLFSRLQQLGCAVTNDADPHLLADNRRVGPIWLGKRRLAFIPPPKSRAIVLRSRTFVPAYSLAPSADNRELGLSVARLQIDGADFALDDWRLETGWHDCEREGDRPTRRWTAGAALLPSTAKSVIVDLAGEGLYWRMPENKGVAISA